MKVLSSAELSADMRNPKGTLRVVDASTLQWYLITTGYRLKVI